jgi:hypothetical protein
MKIILSVLLIAFLLIFANTRLFAQGFDKHIKDKSLFAIVAKEKINVLPDKNVIANNHATKSFLPEFKITRISQIKRFSNISLKPTYDFNTNDLNDKSNNLPAKSNERKFVGKKSLFFPSSEVKSKAWKLE